VPKKSRRAKARHRTRLAEGAQRGTPVQVGQVVAVPPVRTEAIPASMKAQPRPGEAAERYQYVVSEVRRIGILAGSIFLVIVVLSLILS
jgi:hypothetical protein